MTFDILKFMQPNINIPFSTVVKVEKDKLVYCHEKYMIIQNGNQGFESGTYLDEKGKESLEIFYPQYEKNFRSDLELLADSSKIVKFIKKASKHPINKKKNFNFVEITLSNGKKIYFRLQICKKIALFLKYCPKSDIFQAKWQDFYFSVVDSETKNTMVFLSHTDKIIYTCKSERLSYSLIKYQC